MHHNLFPGPAAHAYTHTVSDRKLKATSQALTPSLLPQFSIANAFATDQ